MHPKSYSSLHRQRGSMLIIAVFAITALAALGAALMQISWSQSDTTTREVLGTRAWLAANSGTEMAMARLFPLVTAESPIPSADCSATPVIVPFNDKGLSGCSVSVTCQVEGTGELAQYRVESKGMCGSGAHKVVRVQESWARGLEQ
ncbi:MSHA biogenesis protein MshP [Enterovibrio paralichthyis]|uniref:MSHA biogenesis protein MshP n=1 Tax=Enterovibrio paralichthyis TaxID=2853805 RepID=UPI001C48FA14|nr:MSHA biogenesis protein MshP [Enterovibrio paralichthyis]MBV7297973.1 MSHA biogenesis protein MshP [Enterovibrio paralichthyis]